MGRVVTVNLPAELAARLDVVGDRLERSKSWILKDSVSQWLADEERRHELTIEGLADIDAGRTFSQQAIEAMVAQRKIERRAA